MRAGIVGAVYRKEMRELLRDRKTVLLTFAMPLVVYPLLIIGVASVMMAVASSYETKSYAVAVQVGAELTAYLREAPEDADYRFVLAEEGDPEELLAAGEADALVREENGTVTVAYNASAPNSAHAADYLKERLESYRKQLSVSLLRQAGLQPEEYLEPLRLRMENRASQEQSMGSVLGMIVPLLLITGVFTGAMTPAIDVTAGEKERGTQETLMTFPVSGRELVCGKFLAVSTAGAVSAALYLVTVGILGGYLSGLVRQQDLRLDVASFVPTVAVTVVSVLAFSLFLGAAIMCICVFAKSTKEANSYVSPILIVIMLISYAGYLDVRLTLALSVVPVLNIVLLIKSVLQFEFDAAAILLVLASNIACAALAISLLGRLYTSERMLFGEKGGSLLNRPERREAGALPTLGDSVLVLAVTAVLYLYLGTLFQLKLLLWGLGLAQLILLAAPVFAAWYGKTDFSAVFSLKKPRLSQLAACTVLAAGAYLLCNGLVQPLSALAGDSAETYSRAIDFLLGGQSFPAVWLVLALCPALCEEALFRGYFFAALRRGGKPWLAVLLSALVFGVYHMNLFQSSYAFLLGLFLAWAVWKTGSIFCSAWMHLLCNSFSLLLGLFPEQAARALPFLSEEAGAGGLALALGAGALLTALGLAWLRRCGQDRAQV